jgi:large subunit ribosomal protein L18
MAKEKTRTARQARHIRVRTKVRGTAARPRLCVFRSLDHIYAQVVDDSRGHTLVFASTIDLEIKDKTADMKKTTQAEVVGSLVASRALEAGIVQVVFDRAGYKYHGRIKALAEAARKGGLKF